MTSGFTERLAEIARHRDRSGPLGPLRLERAAVSWLVAEDDARPATVPLSLPSAELTDRLGALTAFGEALRTALTDIRTPQFAVRRRSRAGLRELELLAHDGIGFTIEDEQADAIEPSHPLALGIVSPTEFAVIAARWLRLVPADDDLDEPARLLDPDAFRALIDGGDDIVTLSLRGAPLLDLLVREDGSIRTLEPAAGRVALHPTSPLEVLLALDETLGASWTAPPEA